ncbi:MAG: ATP-binding protein [Candidatus Micrarchaeota archaeon]
MDYKDTSEIKVPEKLIDQVIGQDKAVKIIKNAAKQRRNILLVGTPGTGKSMLAQGMAELMPAEELEDVLVYPNKIDENNPLVRVVKTKVPPELAKRIAGDPKRKVPLPVGPRGDAGHGRLIIEQERNRSRMENRGGISTTTILFFVMIAVLLFFLFSGSGDGQAIGGEENKYLLPALIIGGAFIIGAIIFSSQIGRRMGGAGDVVEAKLVVDNSGKKNAPFVDATGSKAGALFGDVKHDPLQSFTPEGKFYVVEGKKLKGTTFANLWKNMQARYPEKIEKKDDYEYMTFPVSEEVYVLSANGDEIVPTRVMSMNRRLYHGRVVKVSFEDGEISTTPEHKFIALGREREAETLEEGDELISV